MKKFIYITIVFFIVTSVMSCGSTVSSMKQEKELAGYTLKNKKELMQQKITDKKNKTVIATP